MSSDVGITNTGNFSPVTAVADQSGFGNNGTCTSPNRPVYETGIFNAATLPAVYFELVGTSTDWVDITTRMTFTNGFSAFVYYSLDATDAPGTSVTTTGNVPLTIVGDNNASFTHAFGLNGGNVSYSSKVGGSFSACTSSGLTLGDGGTHSIAVSHNLNGDVVVYADGSSAATASGRTYDPVNTGFNIIGVGDSHTDQFWGHIAEIRLYNGALTAAQVSSLHSVALAKWA